MLMNNITTTTTPTTTNGNHRDGKEEEQEDSSKFVTIFVKLLPEPNAEEHKNLTRFRVLHIHKQQNENQHLLFERVNETDALDAFCTTVFT